MAVVSPPFGMEYVTGSTMLYNYNYPDGVAIAPDNIATQEGINIGGYNVNGNAYVRFRTVVTDESKAPVTNRLVMWAKITNRYIAEGGDDQRPEALSDSADVYVEYTQ